MTKNKCIECHDEIPSGEQYWRVAGGDTNQVICEDCYWDARARMIDADVTKPFQETDKIGCAVKDVDKD